MPSVDLWSLKEQHHSWKVKLYVNTCSYTGCEYQDKVISRLTLLSLLWNVSTRFGLRVEWVWLIVSIMGKELVRSLWTLGAWTNVLSGLKQVLTRTFGGSTRDFCFDFECWICWVEVKILLLFWNMKGIRKVMLPVSDSRSIWCQDWSLLSSCCT